jgi:hypothetical protein
MWRSRRAPDRAPERAGEVNLANGVLARREQERERNDDAKAERVNLRADEPTSRTDHAASTARFPAVTRSSARARVKDMDLPAP